jgi:hypothetical protein
MSNGFADKTALESKRKARRYKTFEWLANGKVLFESPMAGEFIKIDAARSRVQFAAMQGRKKEHEAAARDLLMETLYGICRNEDRSAFFVKGDETLILEMDPAEIDVLFKAALEFADELSASAGDAQKNSQETSEGSSPSSSGGT